MCMRRLICAYVSAAVLALSFVTLSNAQNPPGERHPNLRIENFGCINENYYRGAQPSKKDYADLAALGVKTIIDLQRDGEAGEQKLVEASGMKFFRIGLTTSSAPTPEQISQFLNIVNDPVNQPVFVHCKGGRHRTSVMTAVYRQSHDSWTPDQAYAEMKRYEFEIGFVSHNTLKNYVFDYPNHLDHGGVTNSQQPLKATVSSH